VWTGALVHYEDTMRARVAWRATSCAPYLLPLLVILHHPFQTILILLLLLLLEVGLGALAFRLRLRHGLVVGPRAE